MKLRILLALLLGILFPPVLQAGSVAVDSLSIEQRLLLHHNPLSTFRSQLWANPAMHYYIRDFSLTSVSMNGQYERRGDAAVIQEGNGKKNFSFQATSFLKLTERDRVFGEVSYTNGRRENVMWNENSDFELLYPYVTGDSIGGFMKGETYRFLGGYAHSVGAWTIGAQISYRASINYRDQDPRPRNVVSDLEASLGVTRALNEYYTLGLSLTGRKYNQKSDIKFLAEKGSTSVYQMLGFGIDYVRFAGTQLSSNYTGGGVGASLDLLPRRGYGLSASFGYDYFHVTKELTSINYAPLTEIANKEFKMEIAWTTEMTGTWEYGAKLNSEIALREGTENIFGDPTGNIYPILTSVKQYKNTTTKVRLTGIVGQPNLRWGWTLLPTVGYSQIKPEYKGASRFMEISAIDAGLKLQTTRRMSNLLLTAGAEGGYTSNLKSEYSLPGLDRTLSVGQSVMANIEYLSDDHASVGLSLRGDYTFSPKYALFASGRWLHQAYKTCGATNYGEVSLGFVF